MRLDPRTPLGPLALLYLLVLGAAAFARSTWIGWVFGAMLTVAVVTPITAALRQAWWSEMLLTAVGLGVVVPLASLLEAFGLVRLREDAMALLGPFMVLAAMVPVSGAVRLWRARRHR